MAATAAGFGAAIAGGVVKVSKWQSMAMRYGIRHPSSLKALKALKAIGELTAVGAWISMLPLCLWSCVFLLRSPLSRKMKWRVSVGRWLLGLYVAWFAVSDRTITSRGGRPVEWVRRNALWQLFRSYFRASIVHEFGEEEPLFAAETPHIIACHPHGVISLSVIANVVFHSVLPFDYRVATISQNFLIPLWRDIILALGFVDAARETLKSNLERGISVAIVVGGAEEALDARPGTNDLTLGTRLGFVRLALETGAQLVPVFSFGENELFKQVYPNPPGSILRRAQELGKDKLGFSMPLFAGRWGLPVPLRRRITTVVGRPVRVPHIAKPTEEDVLRLHGEYTRSLHALYEKYSLQFAPHIGQLVIRDSKL